MSATNGTTNGDVRHLPSAKPYEVSDGITIQPPLTRRGHGPALIILIRQGIDTKFHEKTLDPPPLQKWAEEGWAVAQIKLSDDLSSFEGRLNEALTALEQLDVCDSTERTGLIAIDVEDSHYIWKAIDSTDEIAAVISYGGSALQTAKPQLSHISGEIPKVAAKPDSKWKTYNYPDAGSYFIVPAHDDFKSAPAAVSHTRCLTFLKPLTAGPYFDLEALWDEHTMFEFGERDVEKTMGTMVQEPYVNHIPTITGGIGREALTHFYRNHFVFNNPEDTALELVSRTVGIDRVIDEFVFSFTHDRVIDWLAPGIPPTGKKCELPFTSVVNIRGDRLYHEHIGWDQATALRQMGLMPEYLPFPYPVDGKKPSPGKAFEYKVPTSGVEVTRKLVDERSVESNEMFQFGIREVDAK